MLADLAMLWAESDRGAVFERRACPKNSVTLSCLTQDTRRCEGFDTVQLPPQVPGRFWVRPSRLVVEWDARMEIQGDKPDDVTCFPSTTRQHGIHRDDGRQGRQERK